MGRQKGGLKGLGDSRASLIREAILLLVIVILRHRILCVFESGSKLCCSGWPQIYCNPSASAFRILGSEVFAIILGKVN